MDDTDVQKGMGMIIKLQTRTNRDIYINNQHIAAFGKGGAEEGGYIWITLAGSGSDTFVLDTPENWAQLGVTGGR